MPKAPQVHVPKIRNVYLAAAARAVTVASARVTVGMTSAFRTVMHKQSVAVSLAPPPLVLRRLAPSYISDYLLSIRTRCQCHLPSECVLF